MDINKYQYRVYNACWAMILIVYNYNYNNYFIPFIIYGYVLAILLFM